MFHAANNQFCQKKRREHESNSERYRNINLLLSVAPRADSTVCEWPGEKTTQPATVVCKMKAQLEYIHVFARWSPDLHAQSVLSNDISAIELSQKFC